MTRKYLYWMMTALMLAFFTTNAFADTINIPADFTTIQAGINASTNGDTVLVQPGNYIENINYNGKNITVGSLFLTTADTSYISQTAIDGNQNGSGVTFENGEDSTAVLVGFTVKNGSAQWGGGIYCHSSSPSLLNLIIRDNSANFGGGVYCNYSVSHFSNITIYNNNSLEDGGGVYCRGNSSPSINYVKIKNNNAANNGGGIYCYYYSSPFLNYVIIKNNFAEYGGGIYCYYSSPSFSNVTISNNVVELDGGGICCKNNSSLIFNSQNRSNIHSNQTINSKGCGADIFMLQCETIDVVLDTFTVFSPTDYYASPIDNFAFDILHSIQTTLINSDVYVSVDGDDSNTGTSTDEPFRTITHALSVIYSDSLNINTIYLSPGTYSDSTNGEIFPIRWSNCVNLAGSIENETILDAKNNSGVIRFNYINCASIQNISIKNGNTDKGGGIYCFKSSPVIQDMIIENNQANEYGGGIYCKHYSSPYLNNISIENNEGCYGGGIYCSDYSSPILIDVNISDNNAFVRGGGIYCYNNSSPFMEDVIIRNNYSSYGGGIYSLDSTPKLYRVLLISNNTDCFGGGIYCAGDTSPILCNVTIVNNTAQKGSGISCSNNSLMIIENSIVSNNNGNYGIYVYAYGYPSITYSNFYNNEGGNFSGVTNDSIGVNITTNANGDSCDAFYNIQLDPIFIDPLNGDYHLSWANYPIQDSTKSPCIDAGDPSSPPDPDGTIADMGAYYFNQNVSIDDPPQQEYDQLIHYPNPINTNNNELTISFSIQKKSNVTIRLYNIKGQLIATIFDGERDAGNHTISTTVDNLSPGIYFTDLSIDGNRKTVSKIAVLR